MAGYIGGKAVNLSTSGADISGTANLDIVDIDGAVDMATTALVTGVLTANGGAVFNEGSADVDFRVESNGNANMLFVDGGNNRVGIGTATPSSPLSLDVTAGTVPVYVDTNITSGEGSVDILRAYTVNDEYSALTLVREGSTNTGLAFTTTGASTPAEAMRIDSSGNVGIGTNSPSTTLAVETGGIASLSSYAGHIVVGPSSRTSSSGDYSGGILFDQANGVQASGKKGASITGLQDGSDVNSMGITFNVHGTDGNANREEAMRIDSSGNLLVGKATLGIDTNGFDVRPTGETGISVDSNIVLDLNRTTNDGTIINLRKANTTVGSIKVTGGALEIDGHPSASANMQFGTTSLIYPSVDDAADLGAASRRFDDIYATNATIQTSDRNEKQDIASLTATEMLVAKRISALFKTFRWKDKVAAKGNDARTHTGIIAQDVQAAFTAESLDAGDYSLFISTTWWEHDVEVPAVEAVAEVTDEDGNVTTEAVEAADAYTRTETYDTEDEAPEGATSKTRMGIRYPELLSFVAAYNEQRFAAIETRLAALEG